jgi:hypothetical protein
MAQIRHGQGIVIYKVTAGKLVLRGNRVYKNKKRVNEIQQNCSKVRKNVDEYYLRGIDSQTQYVSYS